MREATFSVNFIQVIEGGINELIELRPRLSASLRTYAAIMIAYLEGDRDTLAHLLHQSETSSSVDAEATIIHSLLKARLQIRELHLEHGTPEHLIETANTLPANLMHWRGELLFVAAAAYEVQKDDISAQRIFEEAVVPLEKIGALRKALKARFNTVTTESRLFPKKKLLADYLYLCRKAKQLREWGLAAQALTNISREYQLLGAYTVALKHANRAIALAQRHPGTLPFYLALVHRCHVLTDLGRHSEAQIDYETAANSGFAEIQNALKVISLLADHEGPKDPSKAIQSTHLNATWNERLNSRRTARNKEPPLSGLENDFVRFITDSPRSKIEVLDYLYGTRLDFEVRENRFKALIGRLRKKRSGLILFENGKYRISDTVFLEIVRAGATNAKKKAG